jgi:hypothetical protein
MIEQVKQFAVNQLQFDSIGKPNALFVALQSLYIKSTKAN